MKAVKSLGRGHEYCQVKREVLNLKLRRSRRKRTEASNLEGALMEINQDQHRS